jgi:hypothetical protein
MDFIISVCIMSRVKIKLLAGQSHSVFSHPEIGLFEIEYPTLSHPEAAEGSSSVT